MNFEEALDKLGIPEYMDRIFHSHSHGELFHILEYIEFAKNYNDSPKGWFRKCFLLIVKDAENSWQRPESVFQHIFTILRDIVDKKTKV